MNLLLFRHLWGVNEAWESMFPKIKEAGYIGIECVLPESNDRERFKRLLGEFGFQYIAQIVTQGSSVREHVDSFHRQLDDAQSLQPKLVNAHSGRDSFTQTDAFQFFTEALKIEENAGCPVAHETHRGRILYNPWIAYQILQAFPNLKLCCDFSHWVCVCERLLDNEIEIIQQCAKHCIHIHARVGYEEGPQVPDPRAPEYQRHLEAHERWWRVIWATQHARGLKESTLTPEFGPPDYLHTLPYTNAPVADLWDICNWQATRQVENFDTLFKAT